MTSVWFDLPPGQVLPQHDWYKHLAIGHSIRTVRPPLQLTRKMAHWFSQAPNHYTATAALRWAQVRGLGGTEQLARAVIATRLCTVFENEDFWLAILQFFVNNPKLDLAHIGPVVDFLKHERFTLQEHVVHGVLVRRSPLQPTFSIKGRTVQSLLRQVAEWHQRLGIDTTRLAVRWSRSNIAEYELVEGCEHLRNMRRWTIKELLTSEELLAEGRAMRHCVATYAEKCARRRTSIWSLRVESEEGVRPVLTIEVHLATRTICQVRGKRNRLAKSHEREVVRRWATKERLRIADQI